MVLSALFKCYITIALIIRPSISIILLNFIIWGRFLVDNFLNFFNYKHVLPQNTRLFDRLFFCYWLVFALNTPLFLLDYTNFKLNTISIPIHLFIFLITFFFLITLETLLPTVIKSTLASSIFISLGVLFFISTPLILLSVGSIKGFFIPLMWLIGLVSFFKFLRRMERSTPLYKTAEFVAEISKAAGDEASKEIKQVWKKAPPPLKFGFVAAACVIVGAYSYLSIEGLYLENKQKKLSIRSVELDVKTKENQINILSQQKASKPFSPIFSIKDLNTSLMPKTLVSKDWKPPTYIFYSKDLFDSKVEKKK